MSMSDKHQSRAETLRRKQVRQAKRGAIQGSTK